MKALNDEKNNLIWHYFDSNENMQPQDEGLFSQKIEELNTWDNHANSGIETYIKGGSDLSFGSFMKRFIAFQPKTRRLLFFHDSNQNEIAGVCVLNTKQKLSHKQYLKDYIKHCVKFKKMASTQKEITVIDAIKALTNNNDSNNLSIDFLVINPAFHKKGFGSRAIKSLLDNAGELSNQQNINAIETSIHESNQASKRIFDKNNFKLFYDDDSCYVNDYLLSEPLDKN